MPSLTRNASYRMQLEPAPSHHTPVSDEDVKYEDDGLDTRSYGDVEEASDPEIQHLQQELHHVRKRRRIMELQADIQQEQQLLFLAQQRIDATADNPIANADGDVITAIPEPNVAVSPGQKRRRSESSEVVDEFEPPLPNIMHKYRGASIKEFNSFTTRVEDHFRRYDHWYRYDERKIADARVLLTDDVGEKWPSYASDMDQAEPTWQDFRRFCLREIPGYQAKVRQAFRQHANARQRPRQSVRDFSLHLAKWEEFMPPSASFERKENLRVRILKSVRVEYERRVTEPEPEDYEDFVALLSETEADMPSRKRDLQK